MSATYFKVVSASNDNRYFSAVTSGSEEIEYKLDVWNKPNVGASQFLFIFDTIDNAKTFSRVSQWISHRPFVIFEGEATDIKYVETSKWGTVFKAEEFPKGTLFCGAFKPVKLVI